MRRPHLLVGVCQRAHGVKGEVLVKSLTDDDSRFFPGLVCQLMSGIDSEPVGSCRLLGVRPVPQGLLLSFEGVESREAAQSFSGVYLAVRREEAIELRDQYEFYSGDLIGMRVSDREAGLLGQVADILDTGSGQILLVEKEGEESVLIPFLRAVILSVDLDSDEIKVDLPPGLLALYRTRDGDERQA